jgi:hypothetical protein
VAAIDPRRGSVPTEAPEDGKVFLAMASPLLSEATPGVSDVLDFLGFGVH